MTFRFFFCCAVVVLQSFNLQAQWQHYDNMGYNCIQSILNVDGQMMGAGSDGIYISTDRGNTWRHTGNLYTLYLTTLVRHGTYLFAGSRANGVYRSTDNGEQWFQPPTDFDNHTIEELLSIDSNLIAITNKGLYVTTDYGISWTKKSGVFYSSYKVEVKGDTIYFEGWGNGLNAYISTDKGNNWIQTNKKLMVLKKEIQIGDSLLRLYYDGVITVETKEKRFFRNLPQTHWASKILSWGKYIIAMSTSEVFISSDNGIVWTTIGYGFFFTSNMMIIDDLLLACDGNTGQEYCNLPVVTTVNLNEESHNESEGGIVPESVCDELVINSRNSKKSFSYVIYDVFGVKRITGECITNQETHIVPLHELTSGLYIFSAEMDGKNDFKKFIVTK